MYKKAVNLLLFIKTFLRPIYHVSRRIIRYMVWTSSSIGNFFLGALSQEKRILLIYDTSTQPFSIGDILIYQAASLVLREHYGVEKVDFVLLYDPLDPAKSDIAFNSITNLNIMYNLASILPVAQVNQHLGSLLVFDSKERLQRFIADSVDLYQIWPNCYKFASRDYLYYDIFNQIFYDYYRKHGKIVELTCKSFLVDWARLFYLERIPRMVPVTVNIRNNMAYQTERNSTIDEWLSFFKYCESRYPVKFIVLCAESEIDQRFSYCGNVIVAKNHHTGIEQELALIYTSAIHMGVGSGPISMAWFNSKPYLMVNTVYGPNYFKNSDMLVEIKPGIQRFCFANKFQRIVSEHETAELLIEQFSVLWESIKLDEWALSDNPEKLIFEPTNQKITSGINLWLR